MAPESGVMDETELRVRDRLVEEEMEEYNTFLDEDFDADFSFTKRLKYNAKAPFLKLLFDEQIGRMVDCAKESLSKSPSDFKESAAAGYRNVCDLIYKFDGPLAETKASLDLGLMRMDDRDRNLMGNRIGGVGGTINSIVNRVCEDAERNFEDAIESRYEHVRDVVPTEEEFRDYRGDIFEIGMNLGMGYLMENGHGDVGVSFTSFAQTDDDYTDWKADRIYG